MNAIIGMENAGFTIIDAKNTSGDYGYAIGKNEHKSYVTWMYDNRDNRTVSFSQGHYFTCNPDAPARTKAEAYADYYRRLADTYDSIDCRQRIAQYSIILLYKMGGGILCFSRKDSKSVVNY